MHSYKYGHKRSNHCCCFCVDIMLRILIVCSMPAAYGVVVHDPLPSATDYKYSYSIQDPYTGDSKTQHEVRQGDLVSGAYSVVGPDGTKRIVEYTADPTHGFQAVIREEPRDDPPPRPKIPYVSKTRFLTKTIYNLEGAKLPLQMDGDNYFTPANEFDVKRVSFDEGRYFEPAL